MKYTPIRIVVPDSGGEEIWLRPSDAKKLIRNTERALERWYSKRAAQGLPLRAGKTKACKKPSKSISNTSREARTALVNNARSSKSSPKK